MADDTPPDDGELYIEYLSVDTITPADRNPKDHVGGDIQASMKRWGYTEPIMLDERTGKLIAGHGRIEALSDLKAAGGPKPKNVKIDEDGNWLVPVARGWRSTDDIEANGYLIASNRLTERGGWHAESLAEMLAEIRDAGHSLDGVGYSPVDVQDMLDQIAGPPDLDELERQLGEPTETDFWPVLRFKVPPALRSQFLALVADVPGGDKEQFEWLVTQAQRGARRK